MKHKDNLKALLNAAYLLLPVGQLYQHGKSGALYKIEKFSVRESTNEIDVIYHAVSDTTITYNRPLKEWMDEFNIDGKTILRFNPL